MTPTGLCRVCDSALQEPDVTFINRQLYTLYFRVCCPNCGASYVVDEKGDLASPTRLDAA